MHPDVLFFEGSSYRPSWDVYNLVSIFRAATNIADDAMGLQRLPRTCRDAGRFSTFFSDLVTKCCGDTIELSRGSALRVIDSANRFCFVDHQDGAGHRVIMTVFSIFIYHFNGFHWH